MRHQNVRVTGCQQRLGCFALKIPNDPARDVLNVERAFAQIGVVDLAQGLHVVGSDFLENPFYIALLGLELAQHFIDEGPIFDH